LRRASRFITSPIAADPSSTTARSAMAGRSTRGSPSRNARNVRRFASFAGSIFSIASAPYAKASAAASTALPAGRSYRYFAAGCLMKRQPLATIQGARVGEATPARAVTPGTGNASRDDTSASESVVVETRIFSRLSAPCLATSDARDASSRTPIAAV
jgi:hypothetical protein